MQVLYTPPHVFSRGISDRALVPAAVLLLSAALILSSCANAVNSRGGAVGSGGGGGGSSSSAASSAAASQSGSSGTAPDIVVGADSGSYTVASDGHVDYYSDVLGSGSASSTGNYGYVVISPLPSGTLYTDYASGSAVSWSSYTVKVFVDGMEAVSHSFAAGDTEAYVLENVPVGSTLRAQAVIAVSGSSLGYTQLQAKSGTQQMASGSNTITMWVEYPLECRIASAFTGSGAPESISGYSSTVTSYSNAAATALTAPPASYTDGGLPYTFVGWSKENWDGTGTAPEPVLTSRTTIPAGTFKGRVTLYALYETLEEVTVRYVLNLPDGVYPAASGFKLVDSVTGDEDADGEVEVDIPDLLSASPTTAILVPKYAGYIDASDTAYVFKGWKYDSTATGAQISCTPNPAALPGSSPFSPQYYIPAMLAYRDSDANTVTLTAVWEAVDTTEPEVEKAVWRNVSYTVPYYNSHNTFKLCTDAQVKALFDVRSGIIGRQKKDFDGKTITLLDNINVGSMTTSLGDGTNQWIFFKGTLDGNGKTLEASITGDSNTGLFYALDGGTVKNLTLAGSVTGSANYTGGIAGNIFASGGSIEDCTVTAVVSGSGSGSNVYVGGIAGIAYGGTIRRCTASGTVLSRSDGAKVGGIVGNASGVTVTGNTFRGTVTYSGSTATGSAGGIVGTASVVGLVSGNTMNGNVNPGSGTQNLNGY